ncbi:MAG: energy-coupling factor transporter ATPase [Clostridia bacterium]|nr:energy-coupling factor transporter ATPase [Clostridia bacterium]
MESKNYIIDAKNLCFSYKNEDGDPLPVIKNVSLAVEKGSFVAVLGHNGSGKSTLAKLLNLVLTPDSGSLVIDGCETMRDDLTDADIYDLRRKIGMVFQNPDNQLVATIVEEDIAFGPENLGIPPKEIRTRVDEALKAVNMTEFAHHSPSQLSGGQKQRIAIAGIIAMLPDCIIFDESTAMLDPAGRAEVMDTIERLNKEKGITVLLITHYMDEAVRADRVVVMNHGEILLDDAPRHVFSEVEKLKSVGLDVPQVTDLMWRLKKDAGFDLPGDLLHSDEAVEALGKLWKKLSGEEA